MKQVLLVDTPPLFSEFLKEKLTAEKISVETLGGRTDVFAKTVSLLPDLIVMDVSERIEDLFEFFEKKRSDPNAASIPIILTGPLPSRAILTKLPSYQVIKYFNKPIKFDIFFDFIGQRLRIPLSIDTTPSIMEIHLNKNIIFIEIAQGLNREKLSLLKYRIDEMISANDLVSPKVILMISNLKLSFVDAVNLELLLTNLTFDSRIRCKNVKILSNDEFVREFVEGHKEFKEIEVVVELSEVLQDLVSTRNAGDITEVINDDILNTTEKIDESAVEMRFFSESGVLGTAETDKKLQIAVVDDDPVTRKILQTAFAALNSKTDMFDSGAKFLVAANQKIYDLVILDIFMPGISGFDILLKLQSNQYPSPVIIYSSTAQKTSVFQALTLGAKAYLVKPLKPTVLIQKALEILKVKL